MYNCPVVASGTVVMGTHTLHLGSARELANSLLRRELISPLVLVVNLQ